MKRNRFGFSGRTLAVAVTLPLAFDFLSCPVRHCPQAQFCRTPDRTAALLGGFRMERRPDCPEFKGSLNNYTFLLTDDLYVAPT
jgi:hypothetical protein